MTQYGVEPGIDAGNATPEDGATADAVSNGPGVEAGAAAPDADTTLDASDARHEAAVPMADAAPPGSDTGAPDAALDATAALPDGSADAAPPGDSGSCSLDGAVLAAELFFDVNWRGTSLAGIVPLLEAGSGQIRILVRLELRGGTPRLRTMVTACSAAMPDFAAGNALVGTEQYAAYIPDTAWDEPTMPRWDLGWELGCSLPGCAIGSDSLVATFGARAAPGDNWPGRSGPISDIAPLDADDDGFPGVTFLSRDASERSAAGVPYTEIPVTWTLTARCARAFVAFQVAGQFHGQLDSCDALSGVVTSGRVEARNVACYAHNEGSSREYECTPDQAQFLDENLPDWTVMGGTWRARRIDPSQNCADVRALFH